MRREQEDVKDLCGPKEPADGLVREQAQTEEADGYLDGSERDGVQYLEGEELLHDLDDAGLLQSPNITTDSKLTG